MGLKHLTEFKLFEEVDAFSRVGDKLWVVLKASGVQGAEYGDERIHYSKRFDPEDITPYEMTRLRESFNKFNGSEVLIEPEIPSDDGYKIEIGSFSVKLNCSGRMVPFNFHKRWDDWWLISCKGSGINWCEGTKLNTSSIVLCDTIRGVDEFLNDYKPE